MRITNGMLTTNFLSDMNRNLKNMSTVQRQMTSGKEISKPSDDPIRTTRAMRLNADIEANNQYKTNIENAGNFLDSTDTALGQMGTVLTNINEKLIAAGNAAYGPDERTAIKNEINQQIAHFSQIMNSNFDGKYLFGGTRVTDKPVTTTTDANGNTILNYADTSANAVNQISSKLNLEISEGVIMNYNIGANDIFKVGTKDLRDIFKNIVDDLENGNTSDITGVDLTDLQAATNNLLKLRAEVGAKENRMDDAKAKNTEDNFNFTEILSNTEDIDVAEKTMQYATLQTVYTSSLQTSAKVLQPSLLDYL